MHEMQGMAEFKQSDEAMLMMLQMQTHRIASGHMRLTLDLGQ